MVGREAEGRLLAVDAGRVQVASIYAPYAPCGYRTRDQVKGSIEAKVDWLRRLNQWADQQNARKPMFLCGDFNVTLDGESEPETLNRSPEEREALNSLLASGFADLYRDFHGEGRTGIQFRHPDHPSRRYPPPSCARTSERCAPHQISMGGSRIQGADQRSSG